MTTKPERREEHSSGIETFDAIKKLIHIISLGILIYLFLSSAKHIDIASTKNDHLTAFRKFEIDTITDINKVKNEAKKDLDTIRSIHKTHSSDSKTQVFLITLLIIIQVILILKKTKQNA